MADIEVPEAWATLDLEGRTGVLMIVGSTDTGKTTFARYLYERLGEVVNQAAFLDGDPGQSQLGPPCTMTLTLGKPGPDSLLPAGGTWRKFTESITPSGHMLPTLSAASRLAAKGREAGSAVIVYDTSGLVDPQQGGLALKYAKFEVLRPSMIFAIQRENELAPLLQPIQRSDRSEVVVLRPAGAVKSRDTDQRQRHRTHQFKEYFCNAVPIWVKWSEYGIYPASRFALQRLVAMEDKEGFTVALGIILEVNRSSRMISLFVPPVDLSLVKVLHLGDVLVDPGTFQDRRMD